jgi:hypothetical protein
MLSIWNKNRKLEGTVLIVEGYATESVVSLGSLVDHTVQQVQIMYNCGSVQFRLRFG